MSSGGRPSTRWWRRVGALAVVGLVFSSGCTPDESANDVDATTSSPTPVLERNLGGTARVAVWVEPNLGAPTVGGRAVAELVWPQLFVVGPDGSFEESLVEPGTVTEESNGRVKRFRIRTDAAWSNDTPIGLADLSRTVDQRFVKSVSQATDGTIEVELLRPYAAWKTLWSGADAISPPSAGLCGGPFCVASATLGLETVLVRNVNWWGAPGPWLDGVTLVYVPDVQTAEQLLQRGEIDVVSPSAYTNRSAILQDISGVRTDVSEASGWWVGVRANPLLLDAPTRGAVFATFDRDRFATVLLNGEANVLTSFVPASDEPSPGAPAPDAALLAGRVVQSTVGMEEPMGALLQRSAQIRARYFGWDYSSRTIDGGGLEGLWSSTESSEYEVVIGWQLDSPYGPCWRCRWDDVIDEDILTAAEAGDESSVRAIESTLFSQGLQVPLWRPLSIVAWRGELEGLRANGYAASGAWNAAEWHLP